MSRRSIVAFWATLVACCLVCPGAAEAQSGPYAHLMPPLSGGSSPVTSSFAVLDPSVAPFEPASARTGVPLMAAYGPSPLFLLDEVLTDPSTRLPVTVVELVAGLAGIMVSGWAFFDAIEREANADITFNSIATAHALSWNLQLTVRSMMRLALQSMSGPTFDAYMPMIIAFPVRGGAGIAPRWTW